MFMVKKILADDGFQNTFVYQSRFNTLGFKKDKVADYVLVENQNVSLNLNFFYYMVLLLTLHQMFWMQNRNAIN